MKSQYRSRKIRPFFRSEMPRFRGGGRFGRARNTKYDRAPGIEYAACIALKTDTGEYLGIKVHRFGWTRDCGIILRDHYQSSSRILELLQGGDLIQLWEEITPKTPEHSFASPERGVCVYVHRDCRCAEPKPSMFLAQDFDELKKHFDVEYYYLFEGGGWMCHHWHETVTLEQAIKEERMFLS